MILISKARTTFVTEWAAKIQSTCGGGPRQPFCFQDRECPEVAVKVKSPCVHLGVDTASDVHHVSLLDYKKRTALRFLTKSASSKFARGRPSDSEPVSNFRPRFQFQLLTLSDRQMVRYVIPKGTRVSIAPVARRRMDWKPHVTRRELEFDRVVKTDEADCKVFQYDKWYIYVSSSNVQCVKDDSTDV